MNPQLERLHDIDGLDTIARWPPGIGWWICAGIALLIAAVGVYLLVRLISFKRSWKNDAMKKLALAEKTPSTESARQTVILLSEYLRRIAVKRFPRKECAGLVGKEWLRWLTAHDPKKFDWEKKGTPLIEIPYTREEISVSDAQMKELIRAIRDWVR